MTSEPTVSVIMAAYNGEQFICEAIESILNQTRKDFEIVVVDDGSSDNTRQVLEPYISNSSIRYIYQANGGLAAARNTGIRAASGKYLCFLDQDDWFENDSLQTRLALYEEHPELGFVFSDFRMAYMGKDSDEITYGESTLQKYDCIARIPAECVASRGENYLIFNQNLFPELILDCFAWIATVMFSRETLEKVGVFVEEFRWSPDHDLCIRIAHAYPVGYIPTRSAIYRQHATNMSLNERSQFDEAVRIRVKYLNPMYGLKGENRRKVKKSISEYCCRRGHLLLGTKDHVKTAIDIGRGIKYTPFNSRCYKYLLYSMIPASIYRALKLLK